MYILFFYILFYFVNSVTLIEPNNLKHSSINFPYTPPLPLPSIKPSPNGVRCFTVAYCHDRIAWMVVIWAPLFFPSVCLRLVEWKTIKDPVNEVDIRICYRGNTKALRDIRNSHKDVTLQKVDSPDTVQLGWDSEKKVYWPSISTLQVDQNTKTPIRPFMVSWNDEPWVKRTVGVALQVECKICECMQCGVCPADVPLLHIPIAVFGFPQWHKGFSIMNLQRSPKFNANAILNKKNRFCAFTHSNCGGHTVTALVRAAFFDYISERYKPVDSVVGCSGHQTGCGRHCPLWTHDHKEQRVGVDNVAFSAISGQRLTNYTQMWKNHKFAICFQNWQQYGYISQNPVNAYLARAIPIVWGAPDVDRILNPDAIIVCRGSLLLDASEKNLRSQMQEMFNDEQKKCNENPKEYGCKSLQEQKNPKKNSFIRNKFELSLKEKLADDFEKCLQKIREVDEDDEKWIAKVSAPLIHFNDGHPTGIWNVSAYASKIRQIYLKHGFPDPRGSSL